MLNQSHRQVTTLLETMNTGEQVPAVRLPHIIIYQDSLAIEDRVMLLLTPVVIATSVAASVPPPVRATPHNPAATIDCMIRVTRHRSLAHVPHRHPLFLTDRMLHILVLAVLSHAAKPLRLAQSNPAGTTGPSRVRVLNTYWLPTHNKTPMLYLGGAQTLQRVSSWCGRNTTIKLTSSPYS